eukprot:757923-Hanusia_phi.AAC.1
MRSLLVAPEFSDPPTTAVPYRWSANALVYNTGSLSLPKSCSRCGMEDLVSRCDREWRETGEGRGGRRLDGVGGGKGEGKGDGTQEQWLYCSRSLHAAQVVGSLSGRTPNRGRASRHARTGAHTTVDEVTLGKRSS